MRSRTPTPTAKKPAATKRVGRGGNAPTRRGTNLSRPIKLPKGPPKGPPKPPGFTTGGAVKKKAAKKKTTKK